MKHLSLSEPEQQIFLVPGKRGLYDPANEHDACGVGFVAHIKGNKSHQIIEQGLQILKNIDHRGAVGAEEAVSDSVGAVFHEARDGGVGQQ